MTGHILSPVKRAMNGHDWSNVRLYENGRLTGHRLE